MCRVYHSQGNSYIRLCCRTGARRGEHVHFEGQPPIGPSGHYLDPDKCRSPRARKEPARRCLGCGSRALSRHEQFCQACRDRESVSKRSLKKKSINALELQNGRTYYQMTIFDYLGYPDKEQIAVD